MFSTVEMAKLLLAGPRQNLDGVLRLCGNLENIHISDYSSETDGMKVGTPHPNANEISTILTKTRSCIASLKPVNKSGKVSRKKLKNHFQLMQIVIQKRIYLAKTAHLSNLLKRSSC